MDKLNKNIKKETNKTWLNMSEEELANIKVSSACMYGRKSKQTLN